MSIPRHMSPSQVTSLGTCGEQYRLNRVLEAPERPNWGGIGGSTVHKITELMDADEYATGNTVSNMWLEEEWEVWWNHHVEEAAIRATARYPQDQWYAGGRASKDWPNKEDPTWWAHHGPQMVATWQTWRKSTGLTIDTLQRLQVDHDTGEITWDDEQPGIELRVDAKTENGHPVVSIIDRVFTDSDGARYLVDIKTGSHTPAWPLQLAINNVCLFQTYGVRAKWAGFWKSRNGGVPTWFDLDQYPDEWVLEQIERAKEIRDRGLFLAQPTNLCATACGVREFCLPMGGDPSKLSDASIAYKVSEDSA